MSETIISIKNLVKSYDNELIIINHLNLDIYRNEFIVILGPSGCGKSTLLRMIAGLERVTSGEVYIDNIAVQDKEPKERKCAMVFQNYALYPHMTVAQNIGYSLKIAGKKKHEIEPLVAETAKIVELDNFLNRYPNELSGGQKQRVAIARGIIKSPSVFLFDEPLSNLDTQLRHTMRVELAQLHKRIQATSIFVTHDQIEAMTLADRIIVLNKGNIEQFDHPKVIYNKPSSLFVANFIGNQPMNLFNVPLINHQFKINDIVLKTISAEQEAQLKQLNLESLDSSNNIVFGIRPEHIEICDEGNLSVKIDFIEDLGSHLLLQGSMNKDTRIQIMTTETDRDFLNKDINIHFPEEQMHFYDNSTEKRLTMLDIKQHSFVINSH